MEHVTVAKDGTGDFLTVQAAINQVRVHPLEPSTIFIKNGHYQEVIVIPDNKSNITLVGESKEQTIISFNNYAEMIDENNQKLGTFKTAVVRIEADDIRLENFTIQNTAGYGAEIGQAVALYVAGDRGVYVNIKVLGNQDTLYTSRGRHYFLNCYIEGHVDFIFGSAVVVFDHCEIHSLRNGYITAASTPNEFAFGFVFLDCKLTSVAQANTVFLGRPWRPYASTIFVRTWMGPHIIAEGWDNWRKKENEATVRYAEFQSTGSGANEQARVSWSKLMTELEANRLTLEQIFSNENIWALK